MITLPVYKVRFVWDSILPDLPRDQLTCNELMQSILRPAGVWEYFCRKVKFGTSDQCWDWQGSCGSNGYGNWHYRLYDLPKSGTAHRRSFILFNGLIGPDAVICHKCNNRKCCNPDHLYAGTHKTNNNDKKLHGTFVKPPLHKGSKQWKSKLKEAQVIEIKRRLALGHLPPHIAPDYKVSAATIYKIKDGSNWAWL